MHIELKRYIKTIQLRVIEHVPFVHAAQSIMLVKELENVEVNAPDAARFQCEVSVSLIKPPVWTLNGEALQPSPDLRLENKGTVYSLTFKKTSLDMSGIVKFTSGKARSSATLRVV